MYTPFASVTRMIISPLRAFIGMPFTSMLTNSSLIRGRCGAAPSGRHLPLLLDDAASAVVDHVLELVAVVLQEALYRPRRGVPERADGVPLDAVGDIEQEREVLAPPLTGQHPLEHAIHPARALAAGRALA